MTLTNAEIKNLEAKAREIRVSVIEMLAEAGSGHTAGSLGMADIFAALYFHVLRHDATNPTWADRDRLVLSNGHICPVFYASLAHAGYFPIKELKTLRKFGSKLQGHPHRDFLPLAETSSGPLGEGLSQAVGMALADRMNHVCLPSFSKEGIEGWSKTFFCLLGDGELDEGSNWEAAMLAGKEKLGNLIAIVDRNNIQIDGFTEDVMPLEPLRAKWEAFGWHALEIDGHDFEEIVGAIEQSKEVFDKPSVILAQTIPGKGVKAFERKPEWHGKAPSKEEAAMAIKEVQK